MTSQLNTRAGSAAKGCVWGWVHRQPTGRDLCPNDRGLCAERRCAHWLKEDVGVVLFELDVAAERVLASDFLLWHAALNHWYLPDEAEDRYLEGQWEAGHDVESDFEQRVRARGLHHWFGMGANPLPDDLEAELQASWERIFVSAEGPFDPDRPVQAVVAEVRPGDIVRWRRVVRRDGRLRFSPWGAGTPDRRNTPLVAAP